MLNLVPVSHIRCRSPSKFIKFISHGKDVSLFNTSCYVFIHEYLYSMSCDIYKLIFNFGYLLEKPDAVGMHYDETQESLVVAFRSGEIYVVSDLLNASPEVDKVLSVEEIRAIEWSPDGELIALISGDCLHLLTSSFVEVKKCYLSVEDFGESSFVTIGWGRKETQFQGSKRKHTADEICPNVEPLVQDKDPYISWRQDSLLFAVSFWHEKSNMRGLKVFNEVGALESENEALPGLEGPISWGMNGALVALCQRLADKYCVSFLEKNGLKHGCFEIQPFFRVKKICWNADSSILALVLANLVNHQECVQLWTMLNYQWDMKYQFSCGTSPVAYFSWDDTAPGKCFITNLDGDFQMSCFILSYDYGRSWLLDKTSSLVVTTSGVDSCLPGRVQCSSLSSKELDFTYTALVRMTFFNQGVVPPPLCQWIVDFPSPVSLVLLPAWKKEPSVSKCGQLCVVSVDKHVFFLDLASREPKLLHEFEIPLPLPADRMVWISPDTLVMLSSIYYMQSTLSILEVRDDKLSVQSSFDIQCNVIGIGFIEGTLIIQNSQGGVIGVDVKSHHQDFLFSLPEPCIFMEVTEYGIFFLSDTFRLYWNADHVLTGVTSFIIHKGCLLATTLSQLKVFKIISEKKKSQLSPLPERHLEGGSKLILAYDHTILLMLPRGNLEAIQPRPLSVLAVSELIDDCKYKEAISLLRRERIHMNLIVDHDQDKFIKNMDKFINEVKPEFISLFIAELKEEDVTSTIFSAFYEGRKVQHEEGKVESVCNCLIEKLLTLDKDKFASVILNGFIKIDRMDSAFNFANTDVLFDHLLLSVDIDKLYHKALSVYNLDAAVKIARKSDMDPKEYVPYIESLKKMDPNYMKFHLDTTYKKYESALEHISKCSGNNYFLECMEHVKKYDLYFEALNIFVFDRKEYVQLCSLFGNQLIQEKSYEEAGLMFKKGLNWPRALEAYSQAGNWRQCVLAARIINDGNVLESSLSAVISFLKSSQRFEELGDLYWEVFQKPEEAVDFYLMDRSWKKAIFLIIIHSLLDKSNLMFDKIEEAHRTILGDIKLCMETYSSHLSRLNTINELEEARKDPKNFDNAVDDISDAFSVSSIRSHESTSSRRTKKSIRKMWNLKQGNPREKKSLIHTLKQMIQDASVKLAGEVKSLCTALLEVGHDDRALEVQNQFSKYIDLVENSRKDIWPPTPEGSDEIALCDKQLEIPPEPISMAWRSPILVKGNRQQLRFT